MKVFISKKTGLYYYYKGPGDYHCKEGILSESDIVSGEKQIKANTGREFLVLDANINDYAVKMKRGPQILLPKDLGYILARAGVDKESFIVEAGGGSGGASVFFGRFVKTVHTYEIVKEHCEIIEKNLKYMGVENVTVYNRDLGEGIEGEKDIDLLFLDMPEPGEILKGNLRGVKSGKYIVCYLPSIYQIHELFKVTSEKDDLYVEEITEVGLRHWKVRDRISRPEHKKEIDHTAFLVFIRKI